MADAEKREKVIRGLECCAVGAECDHCPYSTMNKTGYEGCYQMHIDALALLKAQEPVEPVVDIDTWKCGNCGHTLEHQQLLGDNVLFHEQYNFCPECGRAVKWE